MDTTSKIKLTEYSHGAGCGCKISPQVLSEILGEGLTSVEDPYLLIGNQTRDDAAVYALDEERALISTTDFFMPIVDDPHDFGGIAAVNALSDVYAMGGRPLMAIAILGWPVNVLPASVAGQVMEGARTACARAGIAIAGGHSIDAPEPIFGLAVTGLAPRQHIRPNSTARPGADLYLTKPLGIGILTTAQKKGLLSPADLQLARDQMLRLNDIGLALAALPGVSSMTDVTGFGLLGHLLEMCEGSGVFAVVEADKVPLLPVLDPYLQAGTLPGGTQRNFASYGKQISPLSDRQKALFCDPQTSGGLLIAADPDAKEAVQQVGRQQGLELTPFGQLAATGEYCIQVR